MERHTNTDQIDRYVRQSQLIGKVLPFSSATLWRKVKEGSFPKPIKLGPSITAWKSKDISSWLESQARASEDK